MVKKSTFCCILTELFLLKYTSMCKSLHGAVCFVGLCSRGKASNGAGADGSSCPLREGTGLPACGPGGAGGAVMSHSSGDISPGTHRWLEGAGLCPARMSWLQGEFFPSRGEQMPAKVCQCHCTGPWWSGQALSSAIAASLLEGNKELWLRLSGKPYPALVAGICGAVHNAAADGMYMYFCYKIFPAESA